ncbi:MAG TPA: UDP-3-O-(3-hydroxymyristoyl)glucosamine N-acyltransferase [Steroidobacteraceae bacterium]|nr:UDP-3-O-(3-hydroxymyristoyl)glucosamine N-acyltransferase [Steroidobacteraceae bacterium]
MGHATASLSLGQLAVRFGCGLRGDPDRTVDSVATLAGGPRSLGFLANPALLAELAATRLAAVVIEPRHMDGCPVDALLHANPHATFARIAAVLHPPPPPVPGVHPTATVHRQAQVDGSAEIGPYVLVAAGAVVGARCRVAAHAIVGARAVLGPDTRVLERASVLDDCALGARCIVHPGAVVGSDGFGNARDGQEWVKVPQLGRVRIGDDVEIGANTTIDRGALGDTLIGDGVRLDNQIQIGHNVSIGAHTAVAACTGIAGSTRIGRRCMIGGGTGIGGQLTIGDDIVIAGFGMVTRSLEAPGMYSSVLPVEEVRSWRRIVGRVKRLDALNARVTQLENAAGIAARDEEDEQH